VPRGYGHLRYVLIETDILHGSLHIPVRTKIDDASSMRLNEEIRRALKSKQVSMPNYRALDY